ncbi:hypothetical protein PVAG01_09107 [Phlyctema vagabunda]|uniref:Uncharacterized protein n=1 Tax=Phlyctema vagabunda TaxID=108571 RepID=A0ABR4P6F0_9HELO
MTCYCANYYGSINCHNAVSNFGDRCTLCLTSYSRRSSSTGSIYSGLPRANEQQHQQQYWTDNSKREQLRREEEKNSRRLRIYSSTSSS